MEWVEFDTVAIAKLLYTHLYCTYTNRLSVLFSTI